MGTTCRRTYRALGRRLTTIVVVTEYALSDKICYQSTSGPLRYGSCRVFEAAGQGTRFTRIEEMDVSSNGILRFVDPVLQRTLRLELQYLKELLEARR